LVLRDSKNTDATVQWTVAATSSKTGGYFYFHFAKMKMQTNPCKSFYSNTHTRQGGFLVWY